MKCVGYILVSTFEKKILQKWLQNRKEIINVNPLAFGEFDFIAKIELEPKNMNSFKKDVVSCKGVNNIKVLCNP